MKKNKTQTLLDTSCPCSHLETPCHPQCTCKNPFSSYGCDNCCSYGSKEQQREKAKHLNYIRLFYEKNQ